ncbi:MAG: glycosyltransferase [Bacteroidetes bacterium]|nr:MAG: glycosyltransferase [Bacteroidota bacterium]
MWHKVSILIAVRNEEENIQRCLQALAEFAYPHACLQILIGNDDSTDNTRALITDFIADKPHFTLCDITEKVGKQAGKANVLTQLASQATGDFWLITDADVAVSPTWVQALEWSQALTIFASFSRLGIAITAQGNNMAMKREAYQATGGYEALPFSVTEDFQLFWAIIKKGYTFRNVASAKGIVHSLPTPTWNSLFKQRRRWLEGALELGFLWQIFLWGRALLFPLLLVAYFFLPTVVLGAIALMWTGNFLTIAYALRRVGKLRYLGYFPFFVFYHEVMLLGTIWYFIRHRRVQWKGREF